MLSGGLTHAARRLLGIGTRWSPTRGRLYGADVLAGVSVALVLIPQSLALAQVAGMPPVRGLYAAALPPLAAALFASSPYLQTGPVALTALLSFGVLSSLATPGTEEYIALGILLALVVGVIRIALGLARGGVFSYLMSQPMLLGFVPGAALLIVATQLPALLGSSPPNEGILERGAWAVTHPGSWQLGSIVLGALTTVLVLVGPRIHRLFPAVLAAVIVGLIVSGLGAQVGAEIGPIDAGFLPIGLDVPWSDLASLLVGGAVIALVGFAEPAAIARTFATLERHRWSADREFVSQGAANVASAISGGFPVGGSFSRSALNRQAGARTRWSGGMTGLVVLIFLPFAGILEPLPTAVLAGIVIGAVVPLVRLRPLVLIWRYSKAQFAVAWATLGLTLALAPNVQWAVVAGVAIAIAVHLARELSLDVETGADGESVILRPVGVLWFGTAHILEDRLVRLLAEHRTARRLVVRLGGVGRLDLSGALALRRLVGHARASGLEVVLDDVPPRARRWVAPLIEDEREPL